MQGWMINKWTVRMNGEDYIIEENLYKLALQKILRREIEEDLL